MSWPCGRASPVWQAMLAIAVLSFAVRAQAQPATTPPTQGPQVRAGSDDASSALVQRWAPHLRQLEGKPIRAISIEVMGELWADAPTIESVSVDTPLSAAVARQAVRELLESGEYAQARADARAFDGGVILRIVAVPQRIVAAIQIDGGILDRNATLAAANIGPESEVTEASFRTIAGKIQRHYRRHGYDRAEVNITVKDTDDPMRVLLLIAIAPQKPRTVSRRIFVIEPMHDRLIGDRKQQYEVETGDRVDEDRLIEADNAMSELLRADGFLDVNVRHRIIRRGVHAFLYIYLETGPQYRFRFNGNQRFSDQALKEALGLVGTSGADPYELAERIQKFYRRRGFYDVRVDASRVQRKGQATVALNFSIVEGAQIRVSERLFPCLAIDAPEGLNASELGSEIDAILAEDLPKPDLLNAVDETEADRLTTSGDTGSRAPTVRLNPASSYFAPSYARALKHLEKLSNSKGYLNAIIGPVTLIRAECDASARAGRCRPIPLPAYPAPQCRRDALEFPLPEGPLDESFTCVPDPKRSISCASEVKVSIPIQLGPRTVLYDMVFEGNQVLSPKRLSQIADFQLGMPFSNLKLENARQRIVNAYRDRGYAYATVRTAVEYSPDKTRARARIIINEHKPVIIDGYEVRGAKRTDTELIIGRLALCSKLDECSDEEKYYRRDLVKRSEEQIATLGTFSSVSISLEAPEIPQQRKRVLIVVVEQRSQYLEPRAGFSTGEGLRLAFEYGHRNIAGKAISLTVRLEFNYLPELLILDPDVQENYRGFNIGERLERRNSASFRFPEVGLGPKVDVVVDGVDVRDNQRDFGLTREAVIPTLSYRPVRDVALSLGASTELNDVTLFGADGIDDAIRQNPALANLLRVPEGRTIAVSQRLSANWDRRDNAFAATRGTLLTSSVEHVSAFPLDESSNIRSEFLRLSMRGAAYLRLTDGGLALAASLAGGYNLQLTGDSQTYPDRLFYLGGVTNMRGFQLDSLVPEDIAVQVLDGTVDIQDVGVRGGNLFVNPRLELRSPITDLLSLGFFLDAGNVWSSKDSINSASDLLVLRYTAGAGMRLTTPVGPMAIDYGINLIRRQWEDFGALHFTIGLF